LNIATGTVAISEEYPSDFYDSEISDLYGSEISDDSFYLYANANESSLDEFMMDNDQDDVDFDADLSFYLL